MNLFVQKAVDCLSASRLGGRAKALLRRVPFVERQVRRVLGLAPAGEAAALPDWRQPGPNPEASRDLRGLFCPAPFRQLDVHETGKAYLCCSSWLPTPIGDFSQEPLERLWNSPDAVAIRESIFDGSFRYCNHSLCPRIQGRALPGLEEAESDPEVGRYVRERRVVLDEPATFVNMCNDASCNLECPSCRSALINRTKGPEFERLERLHTRLTSAFFDRPTARDFTINITGSGDPFASRIFRDFLFELDGRDFPNLKVILQTNGVMLTPRYWDRLAKIRGNVEEIIVSFDAATEATYLVTRRGGHWSTLLANVQHLVERRRAGDFGVLRLDFVAQKDNYHEMADFVRLGKALGVDLVTFSRLVDWGTWSQVQFEDKCIWRRDHPEFERFLEALEDPVFDEPFVFLGNLTEYREEARGRTFQ